MAEEKDAWNQFMATGKVDDYLQFVSAQNSKGQAIDKEEKRTKPEGSHAGFCGSNRDGII